MANFISILKYANKNGIQRQKIYRLIREHKLKEGEDYKKIKKEVERLVIKEDLKI